MSKLFGSVRIKLWIAAAAIVVLTAGALTIPAPAPTTVAPSPERAAPLLEAEVQRRQQLRIFDEIQQLGPRLARHSVTLPAAEDLPPPLPSDLTPPAPRIEPSGHGLIISPEGEVLTSAAALRGRELLELELFDGRRVLAQVVAFDPDADLVLLRSNEIPRTDAAPWATTPPTAGMLAVAVSHAAGQIAVAPVFVMAAPDAGRRVRMTNADLIAGTPLFTTAGEVFAIAAAQAESSAVLIAPAVARLRERIENGQARRGALGLTFQPVDGLLLKAFPTPGVLVADVAPFGPAELGDVQPGDIITAIGETAVATPDAAQEAIASLSPESPVAIQLVRKGEALSVNTVATSALGLRVRQTPRERADAVPDARTLFDAETLAAAALSPQAHILAINGTRVASSDDARALLRRARAPIVLYVEDERGRFFSAVERPQ